jgi:hypothetical protein
MSAVIFTGLISKKLMRRLRGGEEVGGRLGQKIRWTQTKKKSLFDVWEREGENRRERREKLREIRAED